MIQVLPTLTDEEVSRCLPADDEAGFGSLDTPKGPLPLKAVDVRARIDGLLGETVLRQTFVNCHAEPLEATYIFPLPDRAAVTRFRLEVAGRVVEGELKERGTARQEYDKAIKQGHRAAITEEERPGVFTVRVGNLPPGESATVHLHLAGPLPFADGEVTYRFPLVVAPRYIPGAALPGPSVGDGVSPDTDAVPDASRITPPVLLPGFPNPVRLSLAVEFLPSELTPSELRSSLHTMADGSDFHRVELQPGERLNRDFILRWRIADRAVRTGLTLRPDASGSEGTFALTVVPPLPEGKTTGRPRDVAFVLDRSGSMSGWKIVAARRAMARMVDTLTDQDRFTVLAFDTSIQTVPAFKGTGLVPATDRNRFRAVEFLAGVTDGGGTEMAEPLNRAAGELLKGEEGRDRVLVLVTDGQVGNEDQIVRELAKKTKSIRIFTLGIDQAVNAAFLRRLADIGGGTSELVESEDRLDEVMDAVHRHVGSPVLTGLRLEADGLEVVSGSVMPSRLPDLFAGRPVVLLGRYRGMPKGAVTLHGLSADGYKWHKRLDGRVGECAALGSVWARGRVRELEDRYVIGVGDRNGLEREITETSLRFGVLCRFTAFIAVDRSEVVNAGGEVHGIVQPVEQPAGWVQREMACLSTAAAVPMSRMKMRAIPPAAAPQAAAPAEYFMQDDRDAESECVDSCLMDFPEASKRDANAREDLSLGRGAQKRVREEKQHAQDKPGLLERLMQRFRGKPKAIDRTPFVQRLADWQAVLTATTAADRLVQLRGHFEALKSLFNELVTAGDRSLEARRLGEVLVVVESLLAGQSPKDEAIDRAWGDLTDALRALAGDQPPARAGFWK